MFDRTGGTQAGVSQFVGVEAASFYGEQRSFMHTRLAPLQVGVGTQGGTYTVAHALAWARAEDP